jgi:hypothetical protein
VSADPSGGPLIAPELLTCAECALVGRVTMASQSGSLRAVQITGLDPLHCRGCRAVLDTVGQVVTIRDGTPTVASVALPAPPD